MQRDTKIRIRAGSSYAMDQSIDPFLEDEEVEVLYDSWLKEWPIIEAQGGVKIITCDHILEVGCEGLKEAFKGNSRYGKSFREKLIKIAKRNSVF
jgi:hypothetical protein